MRADTDLPAGSRQANRTFVQPDGRVLHNVALVSVTDDDELDVASGGLEKSCRQRHNVESLLLADIAGVNHEVAIDRPTEQTSSLVAREALEVATCEKLGSVRSLPSSTPCCTAMSPNLGVMMPSNAIRAEQPVFGASDQIAEPRAGGSRLEAALADKVLYNPADRPAATSGNRGSEGRRRRRDCDDHVARLRTIVGSE